MSNRHQQTIADLEREATPRAWETVAALALVLFGLWFLISFCSSL
mgnify:CR=1 FL=1